MKYPSRPVEGDGFLGYSRSPGPLAVPTLSNVQKTMAIRIAEVSLETHLPASPVGPRTSCVSQYESRLDSTIQGILGSHEREMMQEGNRSITRPAQQYLNNLIQETKRAQELEERRKELERQDAERKDKEAKLAAEAKRKEEEAARAAKRAEELQAAETQRRAEEIRAAEEKRLKDTEKLYSFEEEQELGKKWVELEKLVGETKIADKQNYRSAWKAVNQIVGQISSGDEQIRATSLKFKALLATYQGSPFQQLIMFLICDRLQRTCDLQVIKHEDSAISLAKVLVFLFQEYTGLEGLMYGCIYSRCPYAIPGKLPVRQPEQSEKDYQKLLGYHSQEDTDTFRGRMKATLILHACLCHLSGSPRAWSYLAFCLNLPPHDMSVMMICVHLERNRRSLCNQMLGRRQWAKVEELLRAAYLTPQLQQQTPAADWSRLQTLLEKPL